MNKKKEFNLDVSQLRYFTEVVHQKSFTRASRKLHKSQSTLSHHISLIEDMLGVKLIDRNNKEFSITREGIIFKEFCENVFKDIEKLNADLQKGISGGISKIIASTIPSTYILPKIISKIREEYPDYFYKIDVHDSREAIELIKDGDAEIGIVGSKIKYPSLVFKRIFGDSIVLIGSVKYSDSISLNELTELPFIGREQGSGTMTAYLKALKEKDIVQSDLNVIAESHTSESIKEMVVKGMGVAFISNLAIENELQLKRLKIIKIKGFEINRDFYLVHQVNRRFSLPAEIFYKKICSMGTENIAE